jgi:hypothetical protein
MELELKARVRYFEDCDMRDLDGVNIFSHNRIPFRIGEYWMPVIDLEKGVILNWDSKVRLKTYFKVCDECSFTIVSNGKTLFEQIDDYVPSILSIDDNGYGDYIFLTINEKGEILNWDDEKAEIWRLACLME